MPNETANFRDKLTSIIAELQSIRDSLAVEEVPIDIEPPITTIKLGSRTCLQCGKPIPTKARSIRGCHDSCYKKVMDAIAAGSISETDAVRLGQLAAKRPHGRPKKQLALDEYLATRHQRSDADAEAIAQKFIAKKKELAAKNKPASKPATKPAE